MGHVPVLLSQVVGGLALTGGARCIDGTLGGAGHAEAMLQATAPDGRLLGLDADAEALARGRERLARYEGRVTLIQASFRDLEAAAVAHGFEAVDAILLDLGISSFQLDDAERGFSFQASGRLDMRMDRGATLSADEIVNRWAQEDLADLFYRFGEEPRSRRVARAVVDARPIRTTTQLAEIVSRALGGQRRGRIHPATRIFQALRIAVNDELGALEEALPQIVRLLAPGGRLAVISFHSLEDRIVKRFIQREARDCVCDELGMTPRRGVIGAACQCGHRASLLSLTRKPIQPDDQEIGLNPRSRSARLRLAERLPIAEDEDQFRGEESPRGDLGSKP